MSHFWKHKKVWSRTKGVLYLAHWTLFSLFVLFDHKLTHEVKFDMTTSHAGFCLFCLQYTLYFLEFSLVFVLQDLFSGIPQLILTLYRRVGFQFLPNGCSVFRRGWDHPEQTTPEFTEQMRCTYQLGASALKSAAINMFLNILKLN